MTCGTCNYLEGRMNKELLILAKSRKYNGYCVAGKDLRTGEWVRPVNTGSDAGLTRQQCKILESNYEITPGKLVSCDVIKSPPNDNHLYQTEDWIFSVNHKGWKYLPTRFINYSNFIDTPDNLWNEPGKNFYNRVTEQFARLSIRNSLYFIHVDSLSIYISGEKRYGRFTYLGITYSLSITDPKYKDSDEVDLEDIYLTISLGLPHKGYAYKLIACILK